MKICRRGVLAGLGLSLLSLNGIAAVSPKLRVIIAYGAGGGNDALMRLFVRHLAGAMPATQISVENDSRGGGRLAVREIAAAAGRDTIALLPSSLFYTGLLDPGSFPIALAELSIVANITKSPRVLVTRGRSLEQLTSDDRHVIVPSISSSHNSYLEPLLINAVAGTRLKPVPGYDGGARMMAVISGEGQAMVGSLESLTSVIELPDAKVVLRLNEAPLPSEYGHVPELRSLARTERAKKIVAMFEETMNIGGLIAGSPQLDPEDLSKLRSAFQAVMKSPEFLLEAAKLGVVIDQTPPEVVETRVRYILRDENGFASILKDALACGLQRADGGSICD